jgi:hypothetical protein
VHAIKKHQAVTTAVRLLPPKKTIQRKKRKKTSPCSGDKTSEQEKALSKPLKPSKKFSVQKGVQSSGLSISEKTLSRKASPRPLVSAKAGKLKAPSASTTGDDSSYALVCVIDLYSSSMSEEEANPLECHRKHARKLPWPIASLKPSRATIVEGVIL